MPNDINAKRCLKLVAGASAGGHVNELLILLSAAQGLWPMEPVSYVTTMEIARAGFEKFGKPVHILGEADRTKPIQSLKILWRSLRIAVRERPDVVVTTGSMPLAFFCFWF